MEDTGCPYFPPEEMLAVAIATLGQSPIYGSRVKLPEEGNISWFIHCGKYSDADDFFQAVHSKYLAEVLPQVIG